MTLRIYYPANQHELKFVNLSQREVNKIISHISNLRQRDGEVDVKVTVK